MEKKCKNPMCKKTLIGKEKIFCKSCKDKGWDVTKKASGAVIGVGLLVHPRTRNIGKNLIKNASKII